MKAPGEGPARPEAAGAEVPGGGGPAGGGGGAAAAAPPSGFDLERALEEVRAGLSRPQKELSPKYFYDRKGSELFERITQLPEYYLTRTERGLLEAWAPELVDELGPAALVELGAGSARKTRILLEPMVAAGTASGRPPLYVPVDVSAAFLEASAAELRRELPGLEVEPRVADLAASPVLPGDLPRPALFAFLGSTLGNFTHAAAAELLAAVRRAMTEGDAFLLGVDLRPGPGKSVAQLEAAYNDARGVTADFNLNVLEVLNRLVGTDFDVTAFRHHAFYQPDQGRIEMHLVAKRPVVVALPGGDDVRLAAGESIRTEISCKYDRPVVEALLGRARLRVGVWRQDPAGRFALVLAVPD